MLPEIIDRNRRLEQQGRQAVLEDLRSRVASLTDRNQHLNDVNRRLEHLVRELRRAMFGQKSEKLHPDQLLLAFEELEGALADAEAKDGACGRGRRQVLYVEKFLSVCTTPAIRRLTSASPAGTDVAVRDLPRP